MACDASIVVPAIVNGCIGVFDGLATVVDVGGGNDATLHMLVKACPWIKGINFDVLHVVDAAAEHNGVKHIGGDMFLTIPKADAVLMKVRGNPFVLSNIIIIVIEALSHLIYIRIVS
eukprot:TRINITY_DN37962_c1_g1_i1.p3 TRINITY_DN37962_c1_g1~~TRINITY_DN37962_c1_g1_i1.p3  ORF type:complete len:117 (-),score=19.77 TRINITY_DN37962_c1_g1_i1:407-757(-)